MIFFWSQGEKPPARTIDQPNPHGYKPHTADATTCRIDTTWHVITGCMTYRSTLAWPVRPAISHIHHRCKHNTAAMEIGSSYALVLVMNFTLVAVRNGYHRHIV